MKDNTQIIPVIDFKVLQEKANEFALKGIISELENFYSAYNSPYRKLIENELKSKEIGFHIDLPDIIGLINERLTKEIDTIANKAVAESFIPLVSRFLTRVPKKVKFSDLLKKFIEYVEKDDFDDIGDYTCRIKENPSYGWLEVNLSHLTINYSFTLHQDYESKNDQTKTKEIKYNLLSLPYESEFNHKTMVLKVDNASLELPFTPDVLKNSFISYLANILISDSDIILDVTDFQDFMFQTHCHCE